MAKDDRQDKVFLEVENIIIHSQTLQDDLQRLGLKIKHHEDKLKFMKTQTNNIDESILNMQVTLGKYLSSNAAEDEALTTEEQTIEHISQQKKTAAGIICNLKIHHRMQASKLPLIKDVLGLVATLGKVNDDNLSRLFSEYLGLETMLAIVCKTYEGVKALEEYDKNGFIDESAGLHGLGSSIGRPLNGRFLVICLEKLRTYTGEFLAEDPQKKLALLKPRLPSGDCPPGFLGFAVNMINVDPMFLYGITDNWHGLRETLFYSLFSRLQVYQTRADLQLALPCISDGAISLDGGMMKTSGLFSLGDRKVVEVRFPTSSGIPNRPADINETKEQLRLMRWKRERYVEEMQREEALLNNVKNFFNIKKQELLQHLSETAQYVTQTQGQAEGNGNIPS